MASPIEPSQEVEEAGGESGFESEKLPSKLSREELQHLLDHISPEDRQHAKDNIKQVTIEAMTYRGLPLTALTVASLHLARKRLPARFRHGKKAWLAIYALAGASSFAAASVNAAFPLFAERIDPLLVRLHQKYTDKEAEAAPASAPSSSASPSSSHHPRSTTGHMPSRLPAEHRANFASGLDSRGRVHIQGEQMTLFLDSLSAAELQDTKDSISKVAQEAIITRGLPATALTVGSVYLARASLPPKYQLGRKGWWSLYALVGVSSFCAASAFKGVALWRERIDPKLNRLWRKHCDVVCAASKKT